jgi:F-type H+-transporting ATPase subunit delta
MNVFNLQVAASYANAWFKQAQEAGLLEQAYQDALLLEQVVRKYKNFTKVLQSPIVPGDKKLAVFQQLFSARVHELTLAVFSMISKKRREAYLLSIVDKFLDIYRAHHQVQLASITTCCKLPADLVGHVKDMVKNWKSCQEVVLQEQVDPAILGGFVLRVGDQQLDNSLVSKLTKIKKAFSIVPN